MTRPPSLGVSESTAFYIALWSNIAIVTFATTLGLLKTGNPSRYFGEGRFTTGISCFQLLLTAAFAIGIHRARSSQHQGPKPSTGALLWLLVAAGFCFLAIDEAFQLHEQMDGLIHRTLALEKTGLTDRIDDAIIATYALIGVLVLWIFRKELLFFRSMLKPLAIGTAFAVVSILCDTISNRHDVFLWLTSDLAFAKKLEGWFAVGDGAFTLLAEGMFAVAFFHGWRRCKIAPMKEG